MDTKQLTAFCAVVERRSFSQAADRLGVTQPAVSLQIRALEERLGQRLLDRSGRRVEPTEAGVPPLPGGPKVVAPGGAAPGEGFCPPRGAAPRRPEVRGSDPPGGPAGPPLP